MEHSAVACRDRCLDAYEKGDCALALELVDQGLARYDDYPDLYFLKGLMLQELSLLPQAAACFSRCTRFRQIPAGYDSWEGITGYPSLFPLAEISARIGAVEAAAEFLQQAWAEGKDLASRFDDLDRFARLLHKRGLEPAAIAALLQERLPLDDMAVARMLYRMGEVAAALARVEQAADRPTLLLKGFCLLALGRHEEAEKAFQWIPLDSPSGMEALIGRLICLWRSAAVHPLAITKLLGEYAADRGHLMVAKELLRSVLEEGADAPAAAAAHACLCRVKAARGDAEAAFTHSLAAMRLAPENSACAKAAVEQALPQCRTLVAAALAEEGESAVLRHTAIQLLSTQCQIRRLREAPVHGDENA
ncbi:hypothetical protein GTO91_06505 [Heliobacterium undosum]|uniref:Tetratricopeptide repeat protein n=1 Tax=Heliomicrobium undosum TaxID=121734 RepID=A0A845L173_9FIRM|nr:hypothetical protein [Heliomicrobium undosum]MZP29356.1 hypothetical protein [Heliomicrobium undosum]